MLRPRKKDDAARSLPCELSVGEDAATLRVPVERSGALNAYLCLSYPRHDPLVVDVAICSPSGAPVLERAVFRADLRASLRRDIWTRGVRLRRAPVGER